MVGDSTKQCFMDTAGKLTSESLPFTTACTRPVQAQTRQNISMGEVGGEVGMKLHPLLRGSWQFITAERGGRRGKVGEGERIGFL